MGKNDAPTFADLIEDAQKVPEGGPLGVDVSSPFPDQVPSDHVIRNMDEEEDPLKAPGVPKYNYEAHVEYYELPTDARAYESTLNDILNGNAILRYEDRHFTKEGDCVVVVNYLTYKPPPKEKDDEEEERRRQGN